MSDSNIYFIDTNIFLRVLVKENEKTFQECSDFLELINQNKTESYINNLIAAEINWVLNSFYNCSKEDRIKYLQSIFELKSLKFCDENNLQLAIHLYKRHNVKFIDAMIASNDLIQKKGAIIISYDKDFDKMGVKRMEPKNLLKKIY